MNKRINVTEPYLPPLVEFIPYLEQIWSSRVLTNCGNFHTQLERELCDFLGVEFVSLFTNGTTALVTALQALDISGEVITTPFSFVATSHSLLWNNIKPVFVDIDPLTLNLDPLKIEAAVTPQTTAILPVHCYGHSCDVDAIETIARRYNLKVIYDAAHAFGVRDTGGSLLRHGDLSVLSFHATKVFNTFEGGAVVCSDAAMKQRIDELKNFGFIDEITVNAPGINGKMSEIQAAMGLLQLKSINEVIERRLSIAATYRKLLSEVSGIQCVYGREQFSNASYFPIIVEDSYPISRDALYDRLKEHDIYARRYFYPLISDFPMYKMMASASHKNLPSAVWAASHILCLPIYPALGIKDVEKIVEVIATS